MYERICKEYVGIEATDKTMGTFRWWDDRRTQAAAKALTAQAKAKRAVKRARKTQLLRRQALRAGAYTYITSDERAMKAEVGSGNGDTNILDIGTDTESESGE